MKRIGTLFCMLLIALPSAADLAQTKERTYAVRYKDDAVESYKVTWTANVNVSQKEETGSPVPYQGAVDFRRCSWSVTSSIERTVALTTRLGAALPLPVMTKSLPPGTGSAMTGTRNETCNQAAQHREGDVKKAKAAILEDFDRLTAADYEALKSEARSKADVVSVADR